MATWITVAHLAEVPVGQVVTVRADGKHLALANVEGAVYAIDDICTHDGGPLGEGELQGYNVECPRHGAAFDVRTGRPKRLPAVKPVKSYQVRVEGEEIQVAV